MNWCHIWNYVPIMINTSVPLCGGPAWGHDDITDLFLPCCHVGHPLGQLLLVVGHPLCPPLLTLLPQFCTSSSRSKRSWASPSTASVGWLWGCEHVRTVHVCVFACECVKRKEKFRVSSYLFKQSQKCTKNLFLLFSLFFLFFLLHPVSHDSHTVYLHTTMRLEVGDYVVLFSTERASLAHTYNPFLNISAIYWGSQPYVLGYTG